MEELTNTISYRKVDEPQGEPFESEVEAQSTTPDKNEELETKIYSFGMRSVSPSTSPFNTTFGGVARRGMSCEGFTQLIKNGLNPENIRNQIFNTTKKEDPSAGMDNSLNSYINLTSKSELKDQFIRDQFIRETASRSVMIYMDNTLSGRGLGLSSSVPRRNTEPTEPKAAETAPKRQTQMSHLRSKSLPSTILGGQWSNIEFQNVINDRLQGKDLVESSYSGIDSSLKFRLPRSRRDMGPAFETNKHQKLTEDLSKTAPAIKLDQNSITENNLQKIKHFDVPEFVTKIKMPLKSTSIW